MSTSASDSHLLSPVLILHQSSHSLIFSASFRLIRPVSLSTLIAPSPVESRGRLQPITTAKPPLPAPSASVFSHSLAMAGTPSFVWMMDLYGDVWLDRVYGGGHKLWRVVSLTSFAVCLSLSHSLTHSRSLAHSFSQICESSHNQQTFLSSRLSLANVYIIAVDILLGIIYKSIQQDLSSRILSYSAWLPIPPSCAPVQRPFSRRISTQQRAGVSPDSLQFRGPSDR